MYAKRGESVYLAKSLQNVLAIYYIQVNRNKEMYLYQLLIQNTYEQESLIANNFTPFHTWIDSKVETKKTQTERIGEHKNRSS